MPIDHEVKKGEWLLKIAHDHGFGDVQPILDDNPGLLEKLHGNPNVLEPGMTIRIPDRAEKSERVALDKAHRFVATRRRSALCLTLQEPDGAPIEDCAYALTFHGASGAPSTGPAYSGRTKGGVIDVRELPDRFDRCVLELDVEPDVIETIELEIGGLDPLGDLATGGVNGKAVQKILANMGYDIGPIDGDLRGERTIAALARFQGDVDAYHGWPTSIPITGLADLATCQALANMQGNVMAMPKASPSSSADDHGNYMLPLPIGEIAKEHSEVIEVIHGQFSYHEPTDEDRTKAKQCALGRGSATFPRFPTTVYVAPSDRGEEAKNPNVIRKLSGRFVYLDVGHWQETHRDFGVIWGPHVYLCRYIGNEAHSDSTLRGRVRKMVDEKQIDLTRLDVGLFGSVDSVEVVSRACAYWKPAGSIDWSTICVVFPDMHIMTSEVGTIFKPGGRYDLGAELNLLAFTRQLLGIDGLRGKIEIVNIGDFYDLWIGRSVRDRPLFEKNDRQEVVLTKDRVEAGKSPADEVKGWIDEIDGKRSDWVQEVFKANAADRGGVESSYFVEYRDLLRRADPPNYWENPAVKAMRMLDKACRVSYISGNHDNYLQLREIYAPGLAERKTRLSWGDVLMEHGNRMDADNRDGALEGFIMAMMLFRRMSSGQDGKPTASAAEQASWFMHTFESLTGGALEKSGHVVDIAKALLLFAPDVLKVLVDRGLVALGNIPGEGLGLMNQLLTKVAAQAPDTAQPMANWFAGLAQRSTYLEEYAKLWLGRQLSGKRPPSIVVMGHTHVPVLEYIRVGCRRSGRRRVS
jgi:hypothetical protein